MTWGCGTNAAQTTHLRRELPGPGCSRAKESTAPSLTPVGRASSTQPRPCIALRVLGWKQLGLKLGGPRTNR